MKRMRNMYFNGNIHGVPMIMDLERHCLTKQLIQFCRKNLISTSYVKVPSALVSFGFRCKDTNPKGCEGERENRVYYSWNGSVNYTQNKFKKFIVRMLFKKMEYKED